MASTRTRTDQRYMAEENDDDDFTFPTTVAAPEERPVNGTVPTPPACPPCSTAPGGAFSRLWPFAAPPIGATITTAAAVKEEEEEEVKEGPAPSTTTEEEHAVVDDEDRMDMLWDDTAPAATRSGGRAEPQHPAAAKPADERAAAVSEQERMDLLWESFNEELLLRRARSKAAAKQHGAVAAPGPPEPDSWYLCPSSTSVAESEEASPGRERYGCAPTMLRASSRAGGAGQFCSSPRRRSRGGWALLLRLFRRLFAVDKAAPLRHSIHVP